MQPSQFLKSSLTLTAFAALVACGGGGGSSSSSGSGTATAPAGSTTSAGSTSTVTAQSVALQTYITDNLATEYSKVWVTIKTITALDGAGAEVTLLDASATPTVVNLSSLASVGQMMSTVSIPTGLYTEIRVTLANALQLVSLDGATTTNAKFQAGVNDFVLRVRNVELDASSSGQLVLDFNLAKFTYDPATQLVTPTVELPKPVDAFKKFVSQKAELRGTVKSVNVDAGTLVIDDARLGKGVIVTLAKDAVLTSEVDGKTLTLAALKAGDVIEIKGTITPGATSADPVTVLAAVLHVEPAGTTPATTPPVRGEGKVKAVSGTNVTVTVDEANFLPGSNTAVLDLSSAKFVHGQLADLAVGVGIEFRGAVSGTGTSAVVAVAFIDVKGAPSAAERTQTPEIKFTGVNGAISAVNASGSFSVNVTQADGPWVVPGTYTVDPKGAVFSEGKPACLIAGAQVKAVGSLTGTALAAKFIEVAGCGDQKRSEPPPAPAGSASAPSTGASAAAPSASAPH
jgi:hypothetical protein